MSRVVSGIRAILLASMSLSCLCTYADHTVTLPTLIARAEHSTQHHLSASGNSSSQYSSQQIKASGQTSISQFLRQQHLANITPAATNPDEHSISLHGFGDNASLNSLLMLDGIPITSLGLRGPSLDLLLPDNIAHITVTPGSQGVLAGSQAIGGIVNITSHTPTPTPVATAGISLGNMGQSQVHTFFSQRINPHMGLSLGAKSDHSNNDFPHFRSNNTLVNGKWNYYGTNNKLSINWIHYNRRSQLPVSLIWGQSGSTNDLNTVARRGNIAYLTNTHIFPNQRILHSQLLWLNNSIRTNVLAATINQQQWLLNNQLRINPDIIGGLNLHTGTYHLHNRLKDEHATEWVTAAYTQIKHQLNHAWQAIAGLRFAKQWLNFSNATMNTQHSDNHVWVSELGIVYHANSHWQWYLRRSGNYRFANGNERMWSTSNANTLHTQTGVAYETGIVVKQGSLNLATDAYLLNINNELSYTPDPQPFGNLVNLPPTQRLGLDLSLSEQLNPYWQLTASGNIVHATISSGLYQGKQIPGVAPVNAGIGLAFSKGQWGLNLNENYHSDYYAVHDFTNTQTKLPPIWTTNLTIQKTYQHVRVTLAIDNLLNNHNPQYAVYQDFADHIYYYHVNGVSVLASIDVSLGAMNA